MDYQRAIKEAETQINMYESMILYNKDFEPKNDNSNYERKVDFLKTAISAMQEMQKYQQFGALEEVREAVERQQALEPSPVLGIYGKIYECKECGNELEMYSEYCPFCGQKQKWGDEE